MRMVLDRIHPEFLMSNGTIESMVGVTDTFIASLWMFLNWIELNWMVFNGINMNYCIL